MLAAWTLCGCLLAVLVHSAHSNIEDPVPVDMNDENPFPRGKSALTVYGYKKIEAGSVEEAEKKFELFLKTLALGRLKRVPRKTYYEIVDEGGPLETSLCKQCDDDRADINGQPVDDDDPRINWICGAYQEAMKSFRSVCAMNYYNCLHNTVFLQKAFSILANNNQQKITDDVLATLNDRKPLKVSGLKVVMVPLGTEEENSIFLKFLRSLTVPKHRTQRKVYYTMADHGDGLKICPRCDEDFYHRNGTGIDDNSPVIHWICGAYEDSMKSFRSYCHMKQFNCNNDLDYYVVGERKCPPARDLAPILLDDNQHTEDIVDEASEEEPDKKLNATAILEAQYELMKAVEEEMATAQKRPNPPKKFSSNEDDIIQRPEEQNH